MSALHALRGRAEGMLEPGHEFAAVTDARTDPQRVAIAFARPRLSWVMTVDRGEYDGLVVAGLLGFRAGERRAA